nr:LysR family transcriptional regulator [Serratia marcescens]
MQQVAAGDQPDIQRTVRRAAARLGVTPPTLTHTLRELEAQVGFAC